MEKDTPSFYAIIPANVRYDKNLCPNSKLLYGEITALTNQKGYCWSGNKYFADLYGVSLKTISRWIGELEDNGYINRVITYKQGSKEVDKRFITLNNQGSVPTDKKEGGYGQKEVYPGYKKVEDNNTSINNTINKNIKDIVPAKADTIPYETIVEYLNLKAGKQFKHKTDATRKLIKARWNEGNGLEEFKKVIDTMVHNWKDDPKMKDYIQPSTLFSTKFENYLNQEKKQTFTNQQIQTKAWEDDIYGNSTNSYDYGYNQQQLSKPNEQNRQQIILQQP